MCVLSAVELGPVNRKPENQSNTRQDSGMTSKPAGIGRVFG